MSLLRCRDGRLRLGWRLTLGWLALTACLWLAGTAGQLARHYLGVSDVVRQVIQAPIVLVGVTAAIIALRRYADRRPLRGMGLTPLRTGWPYLLLGVGFVTVMVGGSLAVSVALGWMRVVDVHFSAGTLATLAVGVALAVTYEAFPEEIAFRGYLYQNLATWLPRWLAMLVQIVLFTLVPLVVNAASRLAGMGDSVTGPYGGSGISAAYVILLATWGLVLQLCRIVTGNLWTNIGFHLGWLSLSPYVIGRGKHALIQVADIVPRTYEEVVFWLGPIVVASLVLLAVPSLRGRPAEWGGRAPERPGGVDGPATAVAREHGAGATR